MTETTDNRGQSPIRLRDLYETQTECLAVTQRRLTDARRRVDEIRQDRDEWQQATIAANRRFERAEADLAELRGNIKSLCDEWDAPGLPEDVVPFVNRITRRLRRALR